MEWGGGGATLPGCQRVESYVRGLCPPLAPGVDTVHMAQYRLSLLLCFLSLGSGQGWGVPFDSGERWGRKGSQEGPTQRDVEETPAGASCTHFGSPGLGTGR